MVPRCVVLISGNGSNLQALIDARDQCQLNVEIVLVVSNRKSAFGLTRAATANVPTLCYTLKEARDSGLNREQYDIRLAEIVNEAKPDVVVLAGWMHILSPAFLDRVGDKVVNLHPALPGKFDGKDAIERAYKSYQDKLIGCTGVMVHMVTPEVDKGRVLLAEEVEIKPQDTLEELEERIHRTEHRLLVKAVGQLTSSLPDMQ